MTIAEIARTERTIRELDPDDVLLLHELSTINESAAGSPCRSKVLGEEPEHAPPPVFGRGLVVRSVELFADALAEFD